VYHKEDSFECCLKKIVDLYRKWDGFHCCAKKKLVYAVEFVCDWGY